MARLPGYENTRTVETGSQFMRPRSTTDQTAKAVQGFGSSLSSIGASLQAEANKLDEKARLHAERTENLEFESSALVFETQERQRLQAAKENARESGAGFYDEFMKEHDPKWQAAVQGLEPGKRAAADARFLRIRQSIALEASGFEQQKRTQFVGKVSKEMNDSISLRIDAGHLDREGAAVEIDEFVNKLGLPPNSADAARRYMGMNADAARIEREIKLNAPGALRDLSRYAANARTSDNPHVQRNIEAANRHGIPLDIALPIIQGESTFDPTRDMSKKINPKTGKPYSSAYGYGQMLDSNWAEVGMTKSSDPDVQAEAVARLLRQRIDYLQRNGIETTLPNVWGAHFVGPGSYAALLRADPNAPLRDVLLPLYGNNKYAQATTGNGSLLQDGATVGQTLEKIRAYTEKNAASVASTTKGTGSNLDAPVEVGGTKLAYMTAADIPKYLAKAQVVAAGQSEDAMKVALKQQVESGQLNTFNAGDRKAMDKHAASTGVVQAMNQGTPDGYGAAKAFLNQHSYLPKPYADEAEMALLSPDPVRRKLGYDLLAEVERKNPLGGLAFSGLQTDIRKRIERYNALQTEMGFSSDQARVAVEREFDPNFQDKVKRDADRVKNIVKRQSQSTVDSHFDALTGTYGFRTTEYGSDATKRQALAAFQSRVQFHLEDGAEEPTAVALAKAEMGRAYGVDTSFGAKRVMHWPPSRVLPAGPDGTHKWVAESVTDHVNRSLEANKLGFKVDQSKVFLIGTAETARTAMTGQGVKYEVMYVDNKGRRQALPGGYVVSPEAYRERQLNEARMPAPKADVAAERAKQNAQSIDAPTTYSDGGLPSAR